MHPKGKRKTSVKKDKNKDIKDIKDIDDVYDEPMEEENIEFDAEEEEFFDEKNFKEFNAKIKFHVFDPDKYENEIHKEIIIVPSQYRKTSEVMTKYEFTEITSNRAKQIENGSKIFVDIQNESDPVVIAELEIKQKRCPLSVRRMISNNIAEIWDVNDMIIPYII